MVVGIMKHKKYNLIRVGLICSSLLFTNSGCGVKTVDCDIEGEHVIYMLVNLIYYRDI